MKRPRFSRRTALAVDLAIAATVLGVSFGAVPANGVDFPAACDGKVTHVYLSRAKYPHIVDHIEDSWDKGYPRVLRVNRRGAAERRERLLSWYERRHPQPKGDGLDLDEVPAASLRRSWRADVRPVAQHENRSAGASLGAQIRGLSNGSCVDYRFTARRS